jgi:hypothetical protein
MLNLHGVLENEKSHGEVVTVAFDRGLFADFWTVFFGKIFIAIRTVKIHSRTEHMRVYDKYFLTSWTSDFNGLTHGLPHLNIRFWIFDYRTITNHDFLLPFCALCVFCG